MIVRIEVAQHDRSSATYWQLKRCQVQREGMIEDVSECPCVPGGFDSLEEAIRHAKRATFTYLEANSISRCPINSTGAGSIKGVFPCPVCHQPLYQKAKLGPL